MSHIKKRLLFTGLIIPLLTLRSFCQDTPNWDGFYFEQVDKPLIGDYKFNELQEDYTVHISDYFTDRERLPEDCQDEANLFYEWAMSLPECDWDFLRMETGGKLTLKCGYRWDGSTDGMIDQEEDLRASMVHDALYDLMRMHYLERDTWDYGDPGIQNNEGDYNRKLADILHFIIAIEDGDTRENAEFEYSIIRSTGRIGTTLESRLRGWKFHVSHLEITQSNGGIRLSWILPDFNDKYPGVIHPGDYDLYRNGTFFTHIEIGQTSYVDLNVEEGQTYTYRLYPGPENGNAFDWSNTVEILVE